MPSTFADLLAVHPDLAHEIRWYLDTLNAPLADPELIRERAEKLNAMARKLGIVVK